MIKRFVTLSLILLLIFSGAISEEQNWSAAPVITKAYELSAGKLYLEWEGNAPVYQVYMDGESVASVIVNNAVIDIKKGTHAIYVYPISEVKSADTKIELGLDTALKVGPSIGGNISLDLAALGLDPQKLTAGTPSAPLNVDYTPSTIFNAAPDALIGSTDFNDCILLTFSDRYYSDEYRIAIKEGKDTNYIRFSVHDESSKALIIRKNSTVTVLLDSGYLKEHECMVPQLDKKYTFSVQLRKYAKNMIDGTVIDTVLHESKESKGYQYTPVAAWKTPPVITYASQTADGQITLQWSHDDNGLECEYAVMKIKKTLGIRRGAENVAVTADKTFVIDDLMNGEYYFAVAPRLNDETGTESEEKEVKLQNDWVVAPTLNCEQVSQNQIKLSWMPADKVETYHIIVYKGNNESLLRFVSLDFSKYAEYDLSATNGTMEFVFTYTDEIDTENGEKFKFEIYGIRHAADNTEQKTASSMQTLTLSAK